MSGKDKGYGGTSNEEEPLLGIDQNGCFQSSNTYLDHFSLEAPSDEIRFRNNSVRVYGFGTQQFQLHECKHHIKAKITSDGSSGLSILRACYTLVSVLMMGFLLIFCLQVLLFLFVSLVMEGGFTSKQDLNFFHLLGTILSIPIFVYGLASACTMASEFLVDTWQGHHFFRSILRWNAVYIDWIAFAVFLGIPIVVVIDRMLTGQEWWEPAALTWVVCVFLSYCCFCLAVFIFEIWGALELLSHHPQYDNTRFNWLEFLKRAILLRQQHRYAGVRHRTFYIEGSHDLPTPNDSYDTSGLADHEHVQDEVSLYSKLTSILTPKFPEYFSEYETPQRQFNIEDVLDRTVFITDATWGLEKLFCRRRAARSVLVVNGSSRVTDPQVLSSLVCALLGSALVILGFAAVLRWAGLPVLAVFLLTAILLLLGRDTFQRIFAIYDTYQDTKKRRTTSGLNVSSEAVYQVTETHRLNHPTDKLCLILFSTEMLLMFVFPLMALLDVGKEATSGLFLILGFFSGCRHYLNAPLVLSELGSLDLLDGQFLITRDQSITSEAQKENDWREKNRLAMIVGKISQGARRDTWLALIGSFVAIFLILFLSAYRNGSNEGKISEGPKPLSDFQYNRQDGFAYPTCSLGPDFQIPDGSTATLADYAYMASLAYVAPKAVQQRLDSWFGSGVAVDNFDLVQTYRSDFNVQSAVHFKLFTFPQNPEFAVLSIRGTQNGWDMISDAQLWSAAALAQIVRGILPLGEIWDPILENLVNMIAVLQDASISKVSFYVQTSDFIKWLQKEDLYPSLRVVGHSLGGGLAMISGAQTNTPAVALSGPNTMISRKTMHPPVSVDDLNRFTFNIIPEVSTSLVQISST